jgi:hypothetical protein
MLVHYVNNSLNFSKKKKTLIEIAIWLFFRRGKPLETNKEKKNHNKKKLKISSSLNIQSSR